MLGSTVVGRANRAEWWSALGAFASMHLLVRPIVVGWALRATGGDGAPDRAAAIIATLSGTVLSLAFLWLLVTTTIRRTHDRGVSEWWGWAFGIGLLLLLVIAPVSLLTPAESLPLFETVSRLVIWTVVAYWAWTAIWLGGLPGLEGENGWGPSPRGGISAALPKPDNYRAPRS